jgi:hypothetical protein
MTEAGHRRRDEPLGAAGVGQVERDVVHPTLRRPERPDHTLRTERIGAPGLLGVMLRTPRGAARRGVQLQEGLG